ncbi:MAG: hypothetical protein OQJ89_05280 [Kangiellaceae bacterium]|nr:hypothetical protein [Kangiellaceae bacterium]MCW9016355.1 hypothetical protein [Kangiellaceae bacterium]
MNKLLLFPDIDKSPSLAATPNCSCDELIWEEGLLLTEQEHDFSNLEFICETTGKVTDFLATDMGAPIVSLKLKTLFDGLDIQAQYFPAKIIEKNGAEPKGGLFAMNVIGMVNCIDFNASDLDVEEEDGEIVDIEEVNTLKLKEDSFGEIYRLYMFERVIVVEDFVAKKLNALNIQGMKLIEPELLARNDG